MNMSFFFHAAATWVLHVAGLTNNEIKGTFHDLLQNANTAADRLDMVLVVHDSWC